MGYYTKYDISIHNLNNVDEGIKMLDELKLSMYFEADVNNKHSVKCDPFDDKWYEWEYDCKRVGKKYPHAIIEIEGVGEEPGDHWKARVRNGETELIRAKIVFDNFKRIL